METAPPLSRICADDRTMPSSDSSSLSTYSCEKLELIASDDSFYSCDKSRGSHKVKYLPGENWDYHLDVPRPVDLSLVLPHYRARNQPIDCRLSMFVGNESAPMKLKLVRSCYRSRFELEVRTSTSDVTIWVPSDFKGIVHCPKSTSFSAGFVNRIMRNVRLNDRHSGDLVDEDEILVTTKGHVTFRMWDVQTNSAENPSKEALRRLFCCSSKAPEITTHDWDFLLEN
ncbi:unnamed protein product [Mycena citricolor]|uniref:Uncharacterized protein n=1 Tax=Mycena citricolor TaxID=2018698 RepID=A0AAD2GVH7_9AGAR|nr:unnamed protein product [Mycena citricolor]CAK5279334.1 unnamed protein product [Mycena citricolor]